VFRVAICAAVSLGALASSLAALVYLVCTPTPLPKLVDTPTPWSKLVASPHKRTDGLMCGLGFRV
jgi:hypothetical protein